MPGPYAYLTRASDTLSVTMAASATTATLSTGSFGTQTRRMILTIDGDVPLKAADFECTVTGTALTAMTLLNGPNVEHSAGATVWCDLVDEGLEGLQDGTAIVTGSIGGRHLSASAVTIGYAQITASYNPGTAGGDVPGLSVTVTVPAGGRRVRITARGQYISTNAGGATNNVLSVYEGATKLSDSITASPSSAGFACPAFCQYVSDTAPSAGSHTYKVNAVTGGGLVTLAAASTSAAYIHVELV